MISCTRASKVLMPAMETTRFRTAPLVLVVWIVCDLDKVSHGMGTPCQPVPGVRLTYTTLTQSNINLP